MPMKLLRWLARNRPELGLVVTIIWLVAGEVREAMRQKKPRRRLR